MEHLICIKKKLKFAFFFLKNKKLAMQIRQVLQNILDIC